MIRKCLKGFLWAGLGVLMAPRWAEAQPPLVITTTVNFSALDGGPNDLDGMDNGVLMTNGLIVRSVGTIILDEPSAVFSINGDLTMQNSGAIRTPSVPTMDPGPFVNIVATGNTMMRGDSLIRSHGITMGGSIFIFNVGDIVLSQRAKIEAHSTVINGFGGIVGLQALGNIQLVNTTNRVTANGMNGGFVFLQSLASSSCQAVSINGTVNAVGFNGLGGAVQIDAFIGGVAVLDGQLRIAAIGTTSPGEVSFFTFRDLTPNVPQTQPPATIVELGNPCF